MQESDTDYAIRLQSLVREKQDALDCVVGEMCDLCNEPHNALNEPRLTRLQDKYFAAESALKYVQNKLFAFWAAKDHGDPFQYERLTLDALEGWLKIEPVENAEILSSTQTSSLSFEQKSIFLQALEDGPDNNGLYHIPLLNGCDTVRFDLGVVDALLATNLQLTVNGASIQFSLITSYRVLNEDVDQVEFTVSPLIELAFRSFM